MVALSNYVNDGGATQNLTFKLTTDIVMTGEENFTPIGYGSGNYFKGTFDGQGHTIQDLDIRVSDENIGLFGKTNDATIKNLTLEAGIISGRNYVGALVGYCVDTTIDNCQVKSVTVAGNSYSPDYYANHFHDVGGLVGQISGNSVIKNCALSYTHVTGDMYVGGLVGEYKGGTITDCTVTGGSVVSNVHESSNAILGQDSSGSATNLGVTTSNVDCYCQWTYTNLGSVGGGLWYCTISNKSGEYTATVTKHPYTPAVYGNLPAVQEAAYLWGCGAEKIKTLILNDVTVLDGNLIGGLTGLQTIDLTNCHGFTTIGAYDFLTIRGSLKEVTLPASVTSIGNDAFYNSGLQTLDLSKCTKLTSIGSFAFGQCTSLKTLNLPASVTSIGNDAFYNSGLQTLDLSQCTGLTSIEVDTFSGCTSLTSVTLPDSVTSIGGSAFSGCTNLTSITLPASVSTIGSYAFYGTGLTSLDLSACTNLTTINNATFYGCENLTSVTLPASVAEIIGTAFSNCPNLTTVNIVVPTDKTLYANGTILNGTGTVNIRNLIGENGLSIGYVESQTVSYLDASGTTTSTNALKIGGNYNNLSAGTYFVDGNFNPYELTLSGEVNLILGDNANVTISNISGGTLNIYSQNGGGSLTVWNSITGNVNFYGGQFSAGTVSGNANITWTSASDTVNVGTFGGNVTIDSGKRFVDTSGNTYSNSDDLSGKNVKALDGYVIKTPAGVTLSGEGVTRIGTSNVYTCAASASVKFSCPSDFTANDYEITLDANGNFTANTDITVTQKAISNDISTFDKDGEVYLIKTAAELRTFAAYVNSGNDCTGKTFRLANDIALDRSTYNNNESNFSGVGDFNGTFDGNGKTISGVQIYSEANESRGLFRSTGTKGVIKNLTLSDSLITAFGFAGGIVGWHMGTVENCRVTDTVTIAADKPIATTHGGIVGYNNYATVKDCISSATVIASESQCRSYGAIVGSNNNGTISNCLALNATVTNNTSNAGAIVGDGGSSNSFAYNTTVNGTATTNCVVIGGIPEGVTVDKGVVVGGNLYVTEGATVNIRAKAGYNITNISNATLNDDQTSYDFTASDGLNLGMTLETVDGIVYVDGNGVEQVCKTGNYNLLTSGGSISSGGWYVVQGNVTLGNVNVSNAEVNLILCDGATLNTGSIGVGNLNIYGQSGGTGTLNATTNSGICLTCNNLNINGGKVNFNAERTSSGDSSQCLWINSGTNFGVDINGGEVTFQNYASNATIWYGGYQNRGFNVNGGKVTVINNKGFNTFYSACKGLNLNGGSIYVSNYTINCNVNLGEGCKLIGEDGTVYNYGTSSDTLKSVLRGHTVTTLDASTNLIILPENVHIISEGVTELSAGRYVTTANEVTLAVDTSKFLKFKALTANGNALTANDDGNYTLSLTSGAATVALDAYYKIGNLDFDDATDTYTINTLADLQALADYVNDGGDTADCKFKLAADISGVNFHIGDTDAHKFKGTLDGNNHKITVSYTATTDNCALFNYVDGATIQKLTVDGTINTSAKYAAGIAAQTSGTTNITDCTSSVEINSTTSGDGTHGGFVGVGGGTLTITNCIFDGELLGNTVSEDGTAIITTSCAGFVGWGGSSTVTINNSLFAPKAITVDTSGSATFSRNSATINGGYYTQAFNDAQGGKQVYKLTLPNGVTATGDNVITFGNNTYAAANATVTISGFNSGEITFDDAITSLTTSDGNIIAHIGDDLSFTINVSFPPDTKVWTVSGTSATYTETRAGSAAITGNKIVYQAPVGTNKNFTLENLASGLTVDNVTAAIDVTDTEITINDATILDASKTVTAPSGYTLKLGDDITQSESKGLSWTQDATDATKYTYVSAGNTAGYTTNGTTISYVTDNRETFTINGLKDDLTTESNASLPTGVTVENDAIKISSDALNAKDVELVGDFTLELDGVSGATTTPEGWVGTTYKSAYVSAAGYEVSGKKITYTPTTTATELFSLSGVDSANGFEVSKSGDKYTVNITNLSYDTAKTITLDKKSSDVSLAYANNFTGNKSQTIASNASLTNGTYTSKTYQAWSELNGESLTIHPATTAKTFTLENLSSAASLDENVLVTDGDTTEFEFKAAALDKKSVSITGDNFSVKLNGDVDTTAETIAESKTLTEGLLSYQASGTGEHYTATNSGITYTEQVGGETFTLSGITNADGVTISDKQVTVAESALNMSATESYSVELKGNDFTLNFNGNTSNAETSATLINGTYTSAYTPAYFTGSGKTYTFTPAETPTTFVISGLGDGAKLNDNVTVSGKTITISNGALTSTHDKISVDDSSYTLQLTGSLVANIKFNQTSNGVTLSGTTAGYKLVNSEYVWQAQVGGETLTITGLKSDATLTADMFTRNGNVITFKPTDELLPDNPTEIIITGGGVIDTSALTTTAKVDAHWSGTTYISEKTASSWTSDAATVTYTAATGGTELFTFNNLKTGVTTSELEAAVDVDGTTLKIKSDVIFDTGKKITAPSGYNFKITDTSGHYAFQDGNGYTLATTSNANGYSNLVRVYEVTLPAFVSVASGISTKDGNKTYAVGNVTLSGTKTGYIVASTATINKDTTISATLDPDTSKHYVFGNATDGYTLATADNIGEYPDLTRVYVVTLPEGVNITSGTYATADGKTYATGNITFSSEDDIKGLERGDGGNYTVNIESDVAFELVTITALTLTDANASAMTLAADVGTVDGSARTKAIKIVGNELNNSIVGGSGNDTLDGSTGDDTLTGNEGNDTFIYSGGKDIITDYGVGTDKISITSDYQSYSIDGNDLIFNFGENNSLTVKNAANNPITLNGASKKFTAEGVMTGTGTAITLNSDVETYTADENLVTIDGSAVTGELKVVGNDKSNRIYAGKGNSTLIGGKSSDYLYGGDGSDTFVYEHTEQEKISYTSVEGGGVEEVVSTIYSAGSDVIYNYGDGDKISLASGVELKDAYKQNDDVIIKVDSGAITVKDSADKSIKFVQGEEEITFSGYVFSKANTSILPATFTNDVTLDSETKNLNASKRTAATKLTGNELDNSIVGGKSSDTLDGGAGDDNLTGGLGNDTFVYNGGKDIITDYAAGDKISLGADVTLKNGYVKNSDTILKIGDGYITVKDTDTVALIQGGNEFEFSGGLFVDSDSVSIPATFPAEFNLGDTYTDANAYMRTSAIKLVGNSDDNKIIGGTKNDTLDGGAGNDTLTGGLGSDMFIYSGGDDVIKDYGTGSDKISTTSYFTSYTISEDDITFTFSDGTLKLEGAADSLITINGVVGKYSNDGVLNSKGTAITLKSDASTYTADADIVTIDGSQTTNAILIGNAKSNRFYGGSGSTFVYNGGSDIVYNYASGDKISLGAESVLKDFYKKNSDVIFRVDSGYITIKGAADESITLEQCDKTYIYSNGEMTNGETVILPATFNGEYTLSGKTNVDASKRTAAIKLTGTNAANSIIGGTKNDTIDGGAGDDTLTGGLGNDLFVYSGGKDIITDYGVGTDKISTTSDFTSYLIDSEDIIFNFGGENSLKVQNGVGKSLNINGVAKNFTTEGIFNSKNTAVTLKSDATTYTAGETVVTIDGSQTNGVTVTGNIKNNRFYAGSGADVFVYEHNEYTVKTVTADGVSEKTLHGSGSDIIYNYSDGDKISLGSDVVLKNGYMKNADFVCRVDDGYITVKNASTVAFTQGDKDFEFNGEVFVSGDSVSIPATFVSEYNLDENTKNLDATMRTSAIKLTGNEKDNSIVGSAKNDTIYGGAGADSLWGGKGNDTLYGGDGSDTFIFQSGEGTDTIFDYQSGDMLQILKSDGKAGGSFTKSSFSGGNLTLTISGGGKVVFEGVSSGDSFNINGKNYTLSGKKLK